MTGRGDSLILNKLQSSILKTLGERSFVGVLSIERGLVVEVPLGTTLSSALNF